MLVLISSVVKATDSSIYCHFYYDPETCRSAELEASPLIVLMLNALSRCFNLEYKTFNWYYWLVVFDQNLQID